jgi:hypothetical protein
MRFLFPILTGDDMEDHILKEIKSFCRSTKVSDKKMRDLYNLFKKRKKASNISAADFELGMLELNKVPAVRCAVKCSEYALKYHYEGYNKFILDLVDKITIEFWNTCTNNVPDSMIKKNEINEVRKKKYKVRKKLSDEEAYEKLLPVNWATMTFSDRISFAKKIQHEGFKNYVLMIDNKIKKYFNKKEEIKEGKAVMRMYTTLFSFPSNNYDDKAKELFKKFIKSINAYGRANLQYVECKNPNIVEIRESR